MCARSSLLGTLSVSLLRSRISYFCHLAQCLAHRSLDECLLSWSITVHFSEMTQPAQCFTFYTAFVHITSLALHISSQRFQDRGHAKPPSVVTCLLSSEATSADSVITHLLWFRQFPSPVTWGCHFTRYVWKSCPASWHMTQLELKPSS